MKKKVIEFDLPKGYSAEDAYQAGIWYIDLSMGDENLYNMATLTSLVIPHKIWKSMNAEDTCNLLLLLAVANGHELK